MSLQGAEDWGAAVAALDRSPVVLTAARRKTVRLALIGVAFTAVGAWEAAQPGTWHGMPIAPIGWAGVVFGALGCAAAALFLVRPPSLTLSSSGFAMSSGLRTVAVAWDEVERFHLWAPSRARKTFVGYTRRGPARAGMESMSRSLGADGAIPDQFDLSPAALLDLCEAARRTWSRSAGTAA